MVGNVLERGLFRVDMANMAEAAGVSEQFLLEHFGDWDGVLFDVLTAVAYGFEEFYMGSLPAETRYPAAQLYRRLTAITDGAWMQPYNKLWSEMIVASGREESPAREITRDVVRGFVELIDAHLAIADPVRRGQIAALLVVQSDTTSFFNPVMAGEHVEQARAALLHLLEGMDSDG